MKMSRSATGMCKLASAKRTFNSVEERCSLPYVSEGFGAVKDCYVRKVAYKRHIDLIGERTEW